MFDFVQQLMAAKAHVQENPDVSVTISLPLDDPRGRKLAEWARKLMLPTTKIRSSGLSTQTGIESPDAAETFLGKLRETVGDGLYYELMTALGEQAKLSDKKRVLKSAPDMSSPAEVGGLLQSGLMNERIRENLESATVERLGNISEALQCGELKITEPDG